jgi:glycosyltransferase involved in cell wall biosynthesis
MTGLSPHRPRIYPSAKSGSRPLWSVMIPTYNCAEYLEVTLSRILDQDPGPWMMQIQVVDDFSTRDDPREVVERVGKGRVEFFRQPANQGHVRNFNTCLQRARGQLVHLLHGDDIVRDGFYDAMAEAFESDPSPGAAFCGVSLMDEGGEPFFDMPMFRAGSGLVEDAVRVMAVKQPVETPSIVVRRDVYERLGGFDQRLRFCGEDLEMWVRIAAHYPVWFVDRYLALYRIHSGSLSGQAVRTGQNIRDVRNALDMIRAYLPADREKELMEEARESVALWAIKMAREASSKGIQDVARTQLKEALRTSRSFPVLRAGADIATYPLRKRSRKFIQRLRKASRRLWSFQQRGRS